MTPRDLLSRIDAGNAPVVVDVRTRGEFSSGHIPGAINRFWRGVLDDQGAWLAEPELRERLAPVIQALEEGRSAIVYCGSGVSACPNVLALHRLGYPQVKLYAGSWSDWVSYPENPVATGEK